LSTGWIARAAVAVAALLMVSGCGPQAVLDGLADGGRAKVVRAVSGDRVLLEDGRAIALAGLAPGADPQALSGLVDGREVRLFYGGQAEGPFHLRRVADRRWVQGALLSAGQAQVRTTRDDRALADEMLREEAKARQARRGLWAAADPPVKLPREVVAGDLDGFQIVEGRVVRAAEAGGRLFLEFGADWRGGFSSETPLQALPGFQSAGLDLRALQGRVVRIRGTVRATSFGPRLTLDHPEQVERIQE
jgi:micrococcal nuclease